MLNQPVPTSATPSPARPATSRILSAAAVRVSHDRPTAAAQIEDACSAAPRIETRLRNGAISEIIVTCPCGQRTVIECDYNEMSNAKTAKA